LRSHKKKNTSYTIERLIGYHGCLGSLQNTTTQGTDLGYYGLVLEIKTIPYALAYGRRALYFAPPEGTTHRMNYSEPSWLPRSIIAILPRSSKNRVRSHFSITYNKKKWLLISRGKKKKKPNKPKETSRLRQRENPRTRRCCGISSQHMTLPSSQSPRCVAIPFVFWA
jgi:hypothetical protein